MSQQHNQYGPGYKPSHVSHHEWRTAENTAEHLIPIIQERVKTVPNLRLLDVGTGSGTIASSLAKYLPQGHVTATDLSSDIIARATGLAKDAGTTNITFEPANAYELPFEDGSFDIVHTSQMLCHMDQPWNAIREMYRVVKDGGVLSCRDSDLASFVTWPELPGMVRSQDLMCKTHEIAGGSSNGGRKMLSWALRAGVPRNRIDVSYSAWCFSSPDEKKLLGERTAHFMFLDSLTCE